MQNDTLAIAAFGDPRSRKTWSGTPASIIESLERSGSKVEPIDISCLPLLERILYFALYHLWRFNPLAPLQWLAMLKTEARSDFNQMRVIRNRRARYLTRELKRRGIRKVLHMVPYSIPVGGTPDPGIEHYLLTDGSAHLEAQCLGPVQRPGRIASAFLETERKLFSRVTHFFTIGEHLRSDLIEFYGMEPSRVTSVGSGRGGVKPYFGPKDYAGGHILFSAKGRFHEKGGPLLLEAFRIAHAHNPNLRLVIAGHESYPKLIGNLPGVTVYGHLPWDQLESLFHHASLFAMPALAEPWGLVYLEALVSRTPILGLRRMSLPELTGSGRFGFMAAEPTPESVAETLLHATADPGRLQKMGTEGQAWCMKKYSWDIAAGKILQAIEPAGLAAAAHAAHAA